jgi:anti-sigma factor RsiW
VTDQPDDAAPRPQAAPAEPSPAPERQAADEPRQVRLRRAPRYRAFVATGAVAGLVIAFGLSRIAADDAQYSNRSVLGYLVVILALIGAVIGGGLAVLVERPSRGGR